MFGQNQKVTITAGKNGTKNLDASVIFKKHGHA
jgi:hypothetical protein